MRKGDGPVEILLVEDSPGDVRLVQEAFRESAISSNLSVVTDGVEAMEFVRRKGKYSNAPRPDIILLDLNLPKKSGRQVLAELKTEEELKRIPVVILTTSEAEEDITRAYELHANCYVIKASDFEQFVQSVKSIEDFWVGTAELPPE